MTPSNFENYTYFVGSQDLHISYTAYNKIMFFETSIKICFSCRQTSTYFSSRPTSPSCSCLCMEFRWTFLLQFSLAGNWEKSFVK